MFEPIHTSHTLNFSTTSCSSHPHFIQVIIVEMPSWNLYIDTAKDTVIKLLQQTIMDGASKLTSESFISRNWRTQHQSYIDRDHEAAHDWLILDHFNNLCVYLLLYFCWRFHMSRSLFLQILGRLGGYSPSSLLEPMHSTPAISPHHQKCIAALHMFAYKSIANSIDEYKNIWKSFAS